MQQQESIQAKKRWDVAEIQVTLDAGCTWGIPARHVSSILEKLLQLNLIEKSEVVTGSIKLNQFKILVRYLHQSGYNTNELPAAFEQWLNDGKKEAPAVKNALDIEIQQVLSTLVSPQLKEPFTIIADGVWGPPSDRALEFIYNTYNIISLERDNELVNVLISLSQRVIKICCSDEWINSRLAYNPFCLVNNEYDEIALRRKGNGVSLFEKAAGREIVHFHSDVAARNNFINTPFARFSAWFMLLRIPTMNYQQVCRLSIKNSEGQWMPVEQLNKPASDTPFFMQPDLTLSFNDFTANIPVAFYSPTEEPIDLIAVFYSGNLQLAITYGYSIQDEQAKGMVRLFDSELLFRNHNYLGEYSEVRFFQKADYCRIFVVKKDFKPYNRQEKYSEFPGTDLPPDFYKLITASASDIYYSVTIGLLLNESKKIPAFNQNRILVVGTGDKQISKSQWWAASSLGRSLADAGYGLISGGWPQVDQVISEAFNNHLVINSANVQERLLQVVTKQQKPSYEYGERVTVKNDKEWNGYVLNNAAAVVMIGGEGGTYAIAMKAKAAGIPVIPIPSTEGDALTFYNEFAITDLEVLRIKSLKDISEPIYSESDAEKAAAAVMEVLQAVIKKPKGSLFQQFKETVEELYKKKKVLIEDDLQKYRWGGNARDNGKRLYGEVKKSKIPGLFNVVLSVSSTDKTELEGHVAFFIHNSFSNEIEYSYAHNGVAKIEIKAYEAFTAAAYTEDGTMLEQDLNEIPRLAKGFYYKSVSDKFKEEAVRIGDAKTITVNDDPQKNRWGGLAVNNGKQVTATVKRSIMPGYFNVSIEVSSTGAENPFMGDVAFFLHPTFRKRIQYRKSTDGKAQLNITAYEAFTIGVYVHDGTMLELDLQQVKGYPDDFYYKQ